MLTLKTIDDSPELSGSLLVDVTYSRWEGNTSPLDLGLRKIRITLSKSLLLKPEFLRATSRSTLNPTTNLKFSRFGAI